MSTTELLSCPFCGGEDHLSVGEWLRGKWFVSCDRCDTDGPCGRLKADAIAAWNRRASQSQQPAPAEPAALTKRDIEVICDALDYWNDNFDKCQAVKRKLRTSLAAAAAVQPPVVQLTESDIRTVATCYGRRDMLPFREPGTMNTEMVNAHIFSLRELTAFARAIEAKVRGIGSVPPSANPDSNADSVHQERRSGGGVRTEPGDAS